MKLKTRDIVYIGFVAALCAVATTIRIEIPGGAMVHLGSAALFTSSILFGGLYGGLGAAIGSALFDLFGGHTQYIVFSFFIKGIAGLIVGGMSRLFAAIHYKTDSVLWSYFSGLNHWHDLDCLWIFPCMVVCS